jgi:uracil-DNA glycosylase
MIVGQSPGVVEGEERRPWRGRAGQTLRRWLELDEEEFYRIFYCASVTRCYPGRHASGRGDRPPTPPELELCRFWLEWELRLLDPRVIVPVGVLAARRLLGIAGSTTAWAAGSSSEAPPRFRSLIPREPAAGSTRPPTVLGWNERSRLFAASSFVQACWRPDVLDAPRRSVRRV